MPKLFGVFAVMEDPHRVWPVYWAIDLEPCIELNKACTREAKQLAEALGVVWAKMEKLSKPDEERWIASKQKTVRNRDYDNQLTLYARDREKLEAEEAAINKRFRDSMYDPLFPVGNQEGWLPEVKYVVWPMSESMRDDFSVAELLMMRAALHRTEEDDGYLPDLSPDEKEEA